MHNQLSCGLLAVLLSATSGFAQFEGVLAMNMTLVSKDGHDRGGGTIKLAIAKAGMRGEIDLHLGQGGGMKSVVLCKTDTPNVNYLITDADRTYTEMDVSQPTGAPAQVEWTVQKLGREKLLGYKTQHVLAKAKTGPSQSMELWLATGFLDFETYRKLQAGSGGEGLTQALKEAGAEGMPLKVVITTEERGQVRMEVVKAEKKSLPASTFEIPAGYTRSR
jgi:hypothetical protein